MMSHQNLNQFHSVQYNSEARLVFYLLSVVHDKYAYVICIRISETVELCVISIYSTDLSLLISKIQLNWHKSSKPWQLTICIL